MLLHGPTVTAWRKSFRRNRRNLWFNSTALSGLAASDLTTVFVDSGEKLFGSDMVESLSKDFYVGLQWVMCKCNSYAAMFLKLCAK
jgi:hypothetical protein